MDYDLYSFLDTNGASIYDPDIDTVYFRGDGISTVVTIPEGKRVVITRPFCIFYEVHGGGLVVFQDAVKSGLLIEIVLEDE